jgi:hypothetical protein
MENKTTDSLVNLWIHSKEEDTVDTKVYRPKTFQLPPSRGRTGFELAADGNLRMHGVASNDKRHVGEGTWQYKDGHLTFSPDGEDGQSFKVVSLEPDKLVLHKMPS